jgi:hypothetical protein
VQQALEPLFTDIIYAVDQAIYLERPFTRDRHANELWNSVYRSLRVRLPGHYGSATARAAALTMRLALIYALLDRDLFVRREHLESALAVWEYCDATAKVLFGDGYADRTMQKLLDGIRAEPGGLSRNDINRKIFGGHLGKDELSELLELARNNGHLVYIPRASNCTHAGVWVAK